MFNNQVRQRVKGLVAGLGPSILANPDQLEAKLADLAPANPQEVKAMVAAARGGVAEEIAAAPPEHRPEMVEQAAEWMASETGLPTDLSRWAVESWNDALAGIQVAPPPPAPQPASASLGMPAGAATAAPPMGGPPPAPWDRAPRPQAPGFAPPPMPQAYGAPPGYGAPPPGAWPPPPGYPGFQGNSVRVWSNTSGMQGEVPPEIARLKWNWGAFGLPFWWMRYHGLRQYSWAWIGVGLVLRFIPGGFLIRWALILAISITLGIMGNKLAWQNRTFNDVNQFFAVQRAWMAWAIPVTILSWIGIAFVVFLLSAGALLPHP